MSDNEMVNASYIFYQATIGPALLSLSCARPAAHVFLSLIVLAMPDQGNLYGTRVQALKPTADQEWL